MLTAHSVADIRSAERAAESALGAGQLMHRAAVGLSAYLERNLPTKAPILMLIGPGNNGGDALYAAVELRRAGRDVDLLVFDPEHVHARGLKAALAAGAREVASPTTHTIVVDALFGIGARPGLSGPRLDRWLNWFELSGPYVIAVDVPSGISVDDGALYGRAICADHTVTFGTHKIGLLLGPASELAGGEPATLIDIGLEDHLGAPAVEVIEPHDGPTWSPLIFPKPAGHKYSRGVVGIVAGSPQYAGAAHLCVAGALSGPAGMIRFVGEPSLAQRVIDRAPEVVAAPGKVDAWVVGPGGSDSSAPLDTALADGVPVLVDASALAHLPERFSVDALLTPHAGELARMLGVDSADIEADPLRHARAAAERWNASVLLKGRRTIIVSPAGRCRANWSGSPWLGTAGAGDVLSGLCGALMARGLGSFDAGSVGAFLHGAASVRANPGGPVTARAIAAWLPIVLADFLTDALDEVRW